MSAYPYGMWANQHQNIEETPMADDKRLPHGAAAVVGGVPIYVKPDMLPGHVELRDKYGLVIGTIRNVASISMTGDLKKD
jgi:hypothetical protein